jgi:hypothetical protein
MKYFVLAAGFALALGVSQMIEPAQAQSNDVRALCNNKYGLGKGWANASEAQRKEAAAKINACIRSGGKS